MFTHNNFFIELWMPFCLAHNAEPAEPFDLHRFLKFDFNSEIFAKNYSKHI